MIDDSLITPPQREALTNCELCGSANLDKLYDVLDKYSRSAETFPLVRCRDCGLAFVNPQSDATSIGDYYPNRYCDAEVSQKRLEASTAKELEKRRFRVRDTSGFVQTEKALDVGCDAAGYAREHDFSNLTLCQETAPDRSALTPRRALLTLLRRATPAISRLMTRRRSSAATELYFRKPISAGKAR